MPASNPTGDPITVTLVPPAIGSHEMFSFASSFEADTVWPDRSKHQKTERHFRLAITVLAVDQTHPSKLEVVAELATKSNVLNGKTEDEKLLEGTYVVTPGPGGGIERDEANVARNDGTDVYGTEQEELGQLFGELLRHGEPIATLAATKALRLGEVVVLEDADKVVLAGGGSPMPGTFNLWIAAADRDSATYALDVASSGPDPFGKDGTMVAHLRTTAKLQRATGRAVELALTSTRNERLGDMIEDARSNSSTITTFSP